VALESVRREDEDDDDRGYQPERGHHGADDHRSVGATSIEGSSADEVEHVLGLPGEQDGQQTEYDSPHRDDDGSQGKMPGQRRQFGLALHDAAQADMRRVEERVQSMVPGRSSLWSRPRNDLGLGTCSDGQHALACLQMLRPVSAGSHVRIISNRATE